MAILSKGCKPGNFESQLNFLYIQGLCLNFLEYESFLESNSPDILALCDTNFNNSINSGSFTVMGYFPLMRKDSVTHMHDLAVYVNKGLPFPQDRSVENSRFLLPFSTGFISLCLISFSSIDHLLCLYVRFLIRFHLT